MERLLKWLDLPAKIAGFATLAYLMIVNLAPGFAGRIASYWAEMLGRDAYVYYEVGKDGNITGQDGRLYLMRKGDRNYPDIRVGDRLLAADDVNLRADPSSAGVVLKQLHSGECVIVVEEPKRPIQVANAQSGGYLKVAAVSCS